MRLQKHLGLLGKLKVQVGELTLGGTEAQRETLANITSIVNAFADLYRQMPAADILRPMPRMEQKLSMQIEDASDETTKVMLRGLLAIIKGSDASES